MYREKVPKCMAVLKYAHPVANYKAKAKSMMAYLPKSIALSPSSVSVPLYPDESTTALYARHSAITLNHLRSLPAIPRETWTDQSSSRHCSLSIDRCNQRCEPSVTRAAK
jgi:hypothetical protein